MAFIKNRAFSAAFFAIVLGVTTSHAKAQNGKFFLPVTAHLGNLVLEPGEYTISAQPAKSWPQVIQISKQGSAVSILATTEAAQPESDKSYLRISTVGATNVIREFSLGKTGKIFTFAPAKSIREETASEPKGGKTGIVAVSGI